MLLASQLSDRIAAVAPVGGIRFPEPNNATRPVPIIAFHGTEDPVNPYGGHGNPEYWDDPVDVAVAKWVRFNRCTRNETRRLSSHVVAERHSDCAGDADVVLVRVEGGGHVWPGSRFNWDAGLGHVTHQINASAMLGQFFAEHPLAQAFPARPGDRDLFPVFQGSPPDWGRPFFAVAVTVAAAAAFLTICACCCLRPKGHSFQDCHCDSSEYDSNDEEENYDEELGEDEENLS
jgi:hypothetical protein